MTHEPIEQLLTRHVCVVLRTQWGEDVSGILTDAGDRWLVVAEHGAGRRRFIPVSAVAEVVADEGTDR